MENEEHVELVRTYDDAWQPGVSGNKFYIGCPNKHCQTVYEIPIEPHMLLSQSLEKCDECGQKLDLYMELIGVEIDNGNGKNAFYKGALVDGEPFRYWRKLVDDLDPENKNNINVCGVYLPAGLGLVVAHDELPLPWDLVVDVVPSDINNSLPRILTLGKIQYNSNYKVVLL